MKSLAMLNFKNISPSADFYSKLDILNKNILYITHQTDKILKLIKAMDNDKGLQEQVDKYFEDDETSPQTDQKQSDYIEPVGTE